MSIFHKGTLQPVTPVSPKEPETPKPTSDTPWLDIAMGELGIHEKVNGENKRILEYNQYTDLKAKEDEIPWCSSFVNFCMAKSFQKRTNSAAARSWLDWGIKCGFKRGAVVIFSRGNDPSLGHVAFCLRDMGDSIEVIGGNQSDSVSITSFSENHVIGYRWPA